MKQICIKCLNPSRRAIQVAQVLCRQLSMESGEMHEIYWLKEGEINSNNETVLEFQYEEYVVPYFVRNKVYAKKKED